ncbi:glycosyltransferase family 39 protein [Candidatus Gottesmanbacteria bacterium]|nr:glycosyltransferase family 39 protein [Candidatus Gottesmanbacteria bacterium]
MLQYILYHTPLFYFIQSIWRDEAFSYFMSLPSAFSIIQNTAQDFNPPFYYLTLHFWIAIFGKSDIGLRLLSFLPHVGSTYIAYLLSRRFFSNRFSVFVALFTFFNPMLLYYAFEIRMYSFYALFTFASIYFLIQKQWKWYVFSAVLGLYTHSFFPLVIVSFAIYFLFVNHSGKKIFLRILQPLIFYLPWMPILLNQFIRSKDSWIFPVDFQLVKSVLGNIFTSYEGTPGDIWHYTGLLSLFIFAFFVFGIMKKPKTALLFFIPIVIPLLLVLTYSFIRRPIFVNRYLIFVAVFEILGVSFGIWVIKNRIIRNIAVAAWFSLILLINLFLPPFHKKTDFKMTFAEINSFSTKNDYVYAKTPISFLESAYYYIYPENVFIYNPNDITIPSYIGTTVVFPLASQKTFPPAPSRTFLIADDGTYDIVISR